MANYYKAAMLENGRQPHRDALPFSDNMTKKSPDIYVKLSRWIEKENREPDTSTPYTSGQIKR